jgi:hypothetical protein
MDDGGEKWEEQGRWLDGTVVTWHVASMHRRSPRHHAVPRFGRRSEVQNLGFGFHWCPNLNISMGFRSGDLLDRTLNPRLGSGPNPVLEVREPDRSQSIHARYIFIFLLFSYDISSLRRMSYLIRLPHELPEAKRFCRRALSCVDYFNTNGSYPAGGAVDNSPVAGPDRGHPDSSLSRAPFPFSHAADSCRLPKPLVEAQKKAARPERTVESPW